MDLRTYVTPLDLEEREDFASRCGTTWGHLRNCMYGYREPSVELAVAIERESGGSVRRQDLFPDSYGAKWPELATPTKEAADA